MLAPCSTCCSVHDIQFNCQNALAVRNAELERERDELLAMVADTRDIEALAAERDALRAELAVANDGSWRLASRERQRLIEQLAAAQATIASLREEHTCSEDDRGRPSGIYECGRCATLEELGDT